MSVGSSLLLQKISIFVSKEREKDNFEQDSKHNKSGNGVQKNKYSSTYKLYLNIHSNCILAVYSDSNYIASEYKKIDSNLNSCNSKDILKNISHSKLDEFKEVNGNTNNDKNSNDNNENLNSNYNDNSNVIDNNNDNYSNNKNNFDNNHIYNDYNNDSGDQLSLDTNASSGIDRHRRKQSKRSVD